MSVIQYLLHNWSVVSNESNMLQKLYIGSENYQQKFVYYIVCHYNKSFHLYSINFVIRKDMLK